MLAALVSKYRELAARRLQNKDPPGLKNKTAKFQEKRGCQNGPRNGLPPGSIFVTVQQNLARQALATLPIAHSQVEASYRAIRARLKVFGERQRQG